VESIAGDGSCPNCGTERPYQQFQPVKLGPGPSGVSDWLRCPACGYRAARARFGLPQLRKGAASTRGRPKPLQSKRGPTPSAGQEGASPPHKPNGSDSLRDRLARLQAAHTQLSRDIRQALKQGDKETAKQLMDQRMKLHEERFDLLVRLALTEDAPPAQ
jgi:hypothetical protein